MTITKDEVLKALLPDPAAAIEAVMRIQQLWVDHWVDGEATSIVPHVLVTSLDRVGGPLGSTAIALHVPFNTAIEKRVAMLGIGQRLCEAEAAPLVVSLACEAWRSRECTPGQRKYLLPEDDPAREEIALVAVATITHEVASTSRRLARGSDARLSFADGWDGVRHGGEMPILGHVFEGFFRAMQQGQANKEVARG